jgi:hypothetical protein
VDQHLRVGRSTDDTRDYAGNVRTASSAPTWIRLSWQNDIKLPVGEALLAYEYTKQKVSGTTDYAVTERTIRSFLAGWNGRIDAAPLAVQPAT